MTIHRLEAGCYEIVAEGKRRYLIIQDDMSTLWGVYSVDSYGQRRARVSVHYRFRDARDSVLER